MTSAYHDDLPEFLCLRYYINNHLFSNCTLTVFVASFVYYDGFSA